MVGRRTLSWIAGIVLGLVFLVAAWAKTLNPAAFAQVITHHGLDFLLPALWVAYLAIALEYALGLLLLSGVLRRWVLLLTSALTVFFVFLNGRDYWLWSQGLLDEEAGCGCFGSLVERTPGEAFWWDLLLLAPPLIVLLWTAWSNEKRPATLRISGAGAVAAAGLLLAVFSGQINAFEGWATRLQTGVELKSICFGGQENRVCMDEVLFGQADLGRHWVILSELDDRFKERIPTLNEYSYAHPDVRFWALLPLAEEEIQVQRFASGAAFEFVSATQNMLNGMARSLPKSFLIEEGRVVDIQQGFPPLGTE